MVALPPWSVQGQNAELKRFSMLLNFPSYMKNNIWENQYTLLVELRARKFYKPKVRPSFSVDVICYATHLRYTSLQAYKLLPNNFCYLQYHYSIKFQEWGVDTV